MTRRIWWSLAVLLLIGIALNGAVLVTASNEVNRIRADFCAWTDMHYRGDLAQQQTAARVRAERSDRELLGRLGCGR